MKHPEQVRLLKELMGHLDADTKTLLFGRNEPALHHDHDTYRAALGMEPLELIEA